MHYLRLAVGRQSSGGLGFSIILYYFAKPEYYFAAGVASLSMDASSGPGMHLIARSRPRSGRGA